MQEISNYSNLFNLYCMSDGATERHSGYSSILALMFFSNCCFKVYYEHNFVMSWTPLGSGRRRGRPTKTWWYIFKEDLEDRGVDWNSVRAVVQTGADGELLLPIVLSRTGGSKC